MVEKPPGWAGATTGTPPFVFEGAGGCPAAAADRSGRSKRRYCAAAPLARIDRHRSPGPGQPGPASPAGQCPAPGTLRPRPRVAGIPGHAPLPRKSNTPARKPSRGADGLTDCQPVTGRRSSAAWWCTTCCLLSLPAQLRRHRRQRRHHHCRPRPADHLASLRQCQQHRCRLPPGRWQRAQPAQPQHHSRLPVTPRDAVGSTCPL